MTIELLICLLVSIQFVWNIYRIKQNDRNEVVVIKKRIWAAIWSVFVGFIILRIFGFWPIIHGEYSRFGSNWSLGSFPSIGGLYSNHNLFANDMAKLTTGADLILSLQMASIVIILYLGPLHELILDYYYGTSNHYYESKWVWMRNTVIAPIVEEIVFRSYLLSVLHEFPYKVVIAPLFFGLAHLHHYLGSKDDNRLANFVFQFAYTFLFGIFCSVILDRSKSIVGPILAHMFCNYMGVPVVDYKYRGSALIYGIGIFGFGVVIAMDQIRF